MPPGIANLEDEMPIQLPALQDHPDAQGGRVLRIQPFGAGKFHRAVAGGQDLRIE